MADEITSHLSELAEAERMTQSTKTALSNPRQLSRHGTPSRPEPAQLATRYLRRCPQVEEE